jgi:hypothetical protein
MGEVEPWEVQLMKKILLIFAIILVLSACSNTNKEDEVNSLKNIDEIDQSENIEQDELPNTDSVTDESDIDEHSDGESDNFSVLFESSNRVVNSLPLDNDMKVFSYLNYGQIEGYNYLQGNELVIENKNILGKQIEEPIYKYEIKDAEIFGISSDMIGMNSEVGLTFREIYRNGNIIRIYDDDIESNLSGYKGYFIDTVRDIYITTSHGFYMCNLTFIGCTLEKQNYVVSIGYENEYYQMPVDGTVLEVLHLPSDEFVFSVLSREGYIKLYITDKKLNLLWKTDYELIDGMEYCGLIINEYDSFLMVINHKGETGKIVKYKNSTQSQEAVVDCDVYIECVSDEGNTYVIGAIDDSGMHKIFVCNRNFEILDQIDLGDDPNIHIENINFRHNHAQKEKQYICTTINHNKKRTRLILDVKNDYDSKSLVSIPEKLRVNVDPSKHMVPVVDTLAFENYIGFNFEYYETVVSYINKGIFTLHGNTYYYIDNLITEVPNIELGEGKVEVYKIGKEILLFYENDNYVGSYSVLEDDSIVAIFDEVLSGNPKVQYDYIDKESNRILLINEDNIILLDLEDEVVQMYENKIDLNNLSELNLYLQGNNMYIYNNKFFYTYDNESRTWIESTLMEDYNYKLFVKSDHVFVYSYNHLYQLDSSSRLLHMVELPEKLKNYYTRGFGFHNEYDEFFFGNYYYDINSNQFILQSHIEKKPFNGIIDDKYYNYDKGDIELYSDINEVILYKTSYIPYIIGEQTINIIDYKKIDETEYFIEYDSNNLYVLEDKAVKKLNDKNIRIFDINNKYLLYSGFYPNDYLIVYDIEKQTEEIIFDKPVEDIYLVNDEVYFLSLTDKDLYKYNLASNETIKLTQDEKINKFYIVDNKIVFESNGEIVITDLSDLTNVKSIQGEIVSIRENNNELICTNDIIVFGYQVESELYQIYQYDNSLCTLEAVLGDKMLFYEGCSFYTENIEVKELDDNIFDYNSYSLNDEFTILDIGHFMSVSVYLRNNTTNEHYRITGYIESYLEGSDHSHILILHDGESIYYKIKDNSSKRDFIWMKFTPSLNKREQVDDVIEEGKVKVICKVRGA